MDGRNSDPSNGIGAVYMAFAEKLKISVEDYLQGELLSDIKHEYVGGEVYAMVGVKRAHDTIAMNLIAHVHAHLRGSSCRVHSGEMKVRVQTEADDNFFYPDMHVTCSADDTHEHFNTQPKLIVEILSDATERYDRAEKFHHYRKLTSLEEYVLIAQDTQRVECYRRDEQWDLQLFQQGQAVFFASIDWVVDIGDIYEGLRLGNDG